MARALNVFLWIFALIGLVAVIIGSAVMYQLYQQQQIALKERGWALADQLKEAGVEGRWGTPGDERLNESWRPEDGLPVVMWLIPPSAHASPWGDSAWVEQGTVIEQAARLWRAKVRFVQLVEQPATWYGRRLRLRFVAGDDVDEKWYYSFPSLHELDNAIREELKRSGHKTSPQ